MAHLIEPNHGPAFWDIVSRYELAERAKGYLMALGFDSDNEKDIEDSQR
jgi:predicted metal-dependent hydrolase